MQPLVSAIIITHNRLPLLQRALTSVLDQTYNNLEIIVVDDGSSDGTEEWLNHIVAVQDPQITSKKIRHIRISSQDSKGGNFARNIGIKSSTGEYIAFLDDDDYWLPEKTAKQINILSKSDHGVAYGKRITEVVSQDGSSELLFRDVAPSLQGDLSKIVLYKMITTSSFLMIKKEVLDKSGLFDENLKFWQDYELIVRLTQITNFYKIEEPVTVYRVNVHDRNKLTNKYFEWKDAVKYIRNKHKNLYSNLSFNERLRSKALVWNDACLRSRNAGLKWVWLWNKSLLTIWRVYNLFTSKNPLQKIKNRLK